MSTISQNLNRLQNAKTAIADAIIAKGGTVSSGDGFEDFANDIDSIPTGYSGKPYLEFAGTQSFTIKPSSSKGWNGTIEYSTDTENWTEWTGSNPSAIQSGNENKLYLRGKNNTTIIK